MLKNYLIVAFRNALRNRVTSIINILGLGLSIGVFILIILFVGQELNVDRSIPNSEKLFRVECGNWAIMGPGFASRISEQIENIEQTAMGQPNPFSHDALKQNGQLLSVSDYMAVSKDFIKVFGINVVMGDSDNPLNSPYALVLTERESKRLFGNENPIGNTLTLWDKYELTVTAVIEDVSNLHLAINALYSYDLIPIVHNWGDYSGWLMNNMNNPTYFKLRDEKLKGKVEADITKFIKEFYKIEKMDPITLRPVKDIYFKGTLQFENGTRHGNLKFIRVMVIVAMLILALASVNYINLSTARAANRAKEIGIRKATGANKPSIVAQFVGESVFTTMLSLLIAITFVELCAPVFSSLIEREVVPSFLSDPVMFLLLLVGSVLLGIVSGLYPAFFLSSFHPARVLKGEISKGGARVFFRKALIVFQFTVSTGLIISTLVINSQLDYLLNYDLGFDKDQIVVLRIPQKTNFDFSTFKERAKNIVGVQGLARSNQKPGHIKWQESYFDSEGNLHNFTYQPVDPDYVDVMGIELVDGRDFDWNRPSDIRETIIINQTFARILELKEPVGSELNSRYVKSTIIGVVKDYNFNSLHGTIGPLALCFRNADYNSINIRVDIARVKETLKELNALWDDFAIDAPFEYSFLNETFEKLYRSELRMGQMFGYFAFIAIFIGCMGLFGLSTFILQSRIKEMGIRKVMGASTIRIIGIMGREFAFLVLISNVIAWPIAWYAMSSWLNGFPYKTKLNLLFFVAAFAISILIALATVFYHSWKTARANPVDSLKYE